LIQSILIPQSFGKRCCHDFGRIEISRKLIIPLKASPSTSNSSTLTANRSSRFLHKQLVNAAPLASQVTLRIGGIAANTQFAGIVSLGLYQFNVVVPSVPDGDNAVRVEIGSGFSQANASLTIRR
jgi:uncharacterized protein (TIGR03437 family)